LSFPKERFFLVSLGISFALALGIWGIFYSTEQKSLFQGGYLGFGLGVLITILGTFAQMRNGGKKAFQALGIFFLIKLLILAGGTICLWYWPDWGDYRAFALSFVVGFFVVMGTAGFWLWRTPRRGVGIRGSIHPS